MRMEGLRDRTKQFSLRVIRLYCSLPKYGAEQVLGKQILRSGTSVAANFREASRARSNAKFVAKLGIVEQELDETMLWLELLAESGFVPQEKLGALHDEAEELIRIMATSIKNTPSRKRSP